MSGPVHLSWPERPGATGYRVIVWRTGTDEYQKFELPNAACRIPPGAVDDPALHQWRVEYREAADGGWVPHFGYVDMPTAAVQPSIRISWAPGPAPAYRVLVSDPVSGAVVAKLGTVWPRMLIDPAGLPAGELQYVVQRAVGADWEDWLPGGALPKPSVSAAPPPSPGAGRLATPVAQRPQRPLGPRGIMLFTCDTEVNMRMMRDPDPGRAMDEQVYARAGGREVGIGAMMDLLDDHGITGTFFVDVLMCFQFGERPVREVCEAILERNHDVQLHLHPAPHLRFAEDPALRELHPALVRDDPALFARALHVGIETFERMTGRAPVAYRSGAYHLCDAFFPVLKEHGIDIDSSLYPYRNCRVSPWMWTRTQPFWTDGVLELPISWILREKDGAQSFEQLSPVLHPAPQLGVLRDIRPPVGGPPLVLTYIAHSYSLLEKHTDDRPDATARWNAAVREFWPVEEYEAARIADDAEVRYYGGPDARRISAMEDFLASVGGRGDFTGISLAQLHAQGLEGLGFDAPAAAGDALPVWHHEARAARLTSAQRYSSWYLEHLEGRG